MLTSNINPTKEEVTDLVGDYFTPSWFEADSLVIYKRDGVGYGLIGLYKAAGETYVASTMHEADVTFPLPMLKDLLKLSARIPMTMITDVREFHDKIQDGLESHGFKFAIMGDIMYSRNNYKGRNDEMVKSA